MSIKEDKINIYNLRVCLTNHDDLNDSPRIQAYKSPGEVIAYLNEKEENAVVIVDADTSLANQAEMPRHFQYIIRGASGELDNFYYGEYPAEDPGDANGGDLTADEAIYEAVMSLFGQ